MKYSIDVLFFIFIVALPTFIQAYSPQPFVSTPPQYQEPQPQTQVSLSSEELEYLHSKKNITMCIDPDWLPLEAIQDGKHVGMTADYFQVMQQHIPVPIIMVPVDSWPQSVEFARSRKCDIFSLAMPTPERETYMDFTKPYLSIPLVMAASINKPFVDDITSLRDVTLGVVEGYAFGEILQKRFPQMTLVDVNSVQHGMQLVVEGKLDGFVGTLATVGYAIQQNFPGELKVAGKFDERWELGVATRNDEPLLYSIFAKVIGSLDQQTHQSILNRWIAVKFDQGTDYTIIVRILIFAGIGIILLLFKNYTLRQYTTKLKAQNNEILMQKEKLQNTEKQLLLTQHAVDTCVFPILWATQGKSLSDTRIVHANHAAVQLLGYQVEEFSGLTLGDLDVENTDRTWLLSLKIIQDNDALAIKTSYRCQNNLDSS
nr:transporter substrate-binding domain-containing protein [Bacteroidales bacterium]